MEVKSVKLSHVMNYTSTYNKLVHNHSNFASVSSKAAKNTQKIKVEVALNTSDYLFTLSILFVANASPSHER